jgi:hypothetical protein
VFVSVCLGVLQHDEKVQHDLQAFLERFVQAIGTRTDVQALRVF